MNEIWNKGQLGAVEGVLGTIDQLIINRCIIEEVQQHHHNLAVAFYNYIAVDIEWESQAIVL